MNGMLRQGDHFPSIKLTLTDGNHITIPDEISSRYAILMFYRGTSKSQSDSIGAWWNHDGSYIEPTEFILGRGGIILGSIYASGPIGRMNPTDVIQLIKAREQKGLSRPGKNVSK